MRALFLCVTVSVLLLALVSSAAEPPPLPALSGGEADIEDGTGNSTLTTTLQIGVRPELVTTEDYYCSSVAVPSGENYIVGFEPFLDEEIAHHMLLFGCQDQDSSRLGSTWNCKNTGVVCAGLSQGAILYAWAKQAPGLKFPKGVGIKIGQKAHIQTIVMQVHFHKAPDSENYPQVNLQLTDQYQPNIAGIYLLGGMAAELKPHKKDIVVSTACKFSGPNVIHPLGFRTHAHSLSPLIAGFVKSHTSKKWNLIGRHSPQEPQAFYPSEHVVVRPGDILAAQCHYDTSSRSSVTEFGPDSENEMCNFYIMFYMENNGVQLRANECWNAPPRNFKFPSLAQFDTPTVSPNETTDKFDDHTHQNEIHETVPPTITLAGDWPMNNLSSSGDIDGQIGTHLGQVTGVSVDSNGRVFMFHRGNHIWNFDSFSSGNTYTDKESGPIDVPALLVTDSSGKVTKKWGQGIFYLPHGLTVASNGVIWMTDVARHQIFKLPSIDRKSPLALGGAFVPGQDQYHFCKPSAIAIDHERGRFYVADGYCNHRIIVFDSNGAYITQYSQPIDGRSLQVPHSLALSADGSKLYVADRENYRIIEYNTKSGIGKVFVSRDTLGGPVYAITLGDGHGHWPMYAVNGSMDERYKAAGFTISESGEVVDVWAPPDGFSQPHDIAVNGDGSVLYVAEIGPNKVWKFNVNHSKVTQKPLPAFTNVTTSSTPAVSSPPISLDTPLDTTSCQPSSTPTSDIEIDYSCPRPPPPPTKCCSDVATGSVSVSCSQCPVVSQVLDVVVSAKRSHFPVIFVVTLLVIMFIILFLVLALVAFVRYRKRNEGQGRPVFKVRRHYTRNPKRKLDVLLHSGKAGFSRVRTFDSESDEEFTVFQKT